MYKMCTQFGEYLLRTCCTASISHALYLCIMQSAAVEDGHFEFFNFGRVRWSKTDDSAPWTEFYIIVYYTGTALLQRDLSRTLSTCVFHYVTVWYRWVCSSGLRKKIKTKSIAVKFSDTSKTLYDPVASTNLTKVPRRAAVITRHAPESP